MDLQPIEVDYLKARETLRQYLGILKEKRTAEDHAIIRSTKAVIAGRKVIRLADAVRAAGTDSNGFPRVAVARSDDTFVACRRWTGSCHMCGMSRRTEYLSDHGKRNSWWGRMEQANPRAFRFHIDHGKQYERREEATAMVPSIPPAHRPPPTAQDRYYVLFEADWEPAPPVDPALLAPLGAGLFVVVAEWDLTEVERAVLAHTRGS